MLLGFNKPMNLVQQRRNPLYLINDNPLPTGAAVIIYIFVLSFDIYLLLKYIF